VTDGLRRLRVHPGPAVLRWVDLTADVLRVAALTGLGYAAVTANLKAVAVFATVVVVAVVPRLAALPRPVDLAVGLTWTVAGWANVLGWYVTHPWVDIPVHATTPGATAAAVYLLLARADLTSDLQEDNTRRPAVIMLTTAVGTTLAVWWEFYEWIIYRDYGPPQVGYDDTLLDLLLGTASSAVAGLGLALWSAAGWGTRRIPVRRR
jgi:hypothetical protein